MPTINIRSLGEQEPPIKGREKLLKLLQPHETSFRWQGKKLNVYITATFNPIKPMNFCSNERMKILQW
jgi:hypothetical protein